MPARWSSADLSQVGTLRCRCDEVETGQRALSSISRTEGEFTLLLADRFDIVWHSETLSRILGLGDVVGRNGTEFVHPDDLELVLEVMTQVLEGGEHQRLTAAYAPEAADIRIADVNGAWHTYETTTWNHLDDENVRGVLCTCRRVNDRSDLTRAIEMLSSGAEVDEVLPIIARLAARCIGGAEVRTAIAWEHDERIITVSAAGASPLDPTLANVTQLVWSHALTAPVVVTDLDDPMLDGAGRHAAAAGYLGAFIVPIVAPTGPEILGAMVAWSASTVDFQAAPQSPIHVALRLAALAIADHRTKRTLRWAAAHDPLTGLAKHAGKNTVCSPADGTTRGVAGIRSVSDRAVSRARFADSIAELPTVVVGRIGVRSPAATGPSPRQRDATAIRRRGRHAVQPFALTRPTHDEEVALPWHQHEIVRCRAGGHALDRHTAGSTVSQYEGPSGSDHHDRDDGLVEPTHLAVAVQTLEVVAVSIEDCGDTGEGTAKAGSQVQIGLTEHRVGVVVHADAEAPLRHIPVVVQHFGLSPLQRVVQFGEHRRRIADEARDHLDP